MLIYFLRHGDASNDSRYNDDERPLTDLGMRQANLVSVFLQRMNVCVDAILSSPYTRAQQTALIVQAGSGKQQFVITEFLGVGADPQRLFDYLSELKISSVILIGHEPNLSETISLLTSETRDAGIQMKKCSLALVEAPTPISPNEGLLNWLIPVDAIAKLIKDIE